MAQGMGGQSSANVTQHLSGAHFPASKQELVKLAKNNGAKDDVIQMLEKMPANEYSSIAEVMKAFGDEAEHGQGKAGKPASRH